MAPSIARVTLADVVDEARVVLGARMGRLRPASRVKRALEPPDVSEKALVVGRVAEITWTRDVALRGVDDVREALRDLRDPLIVRGGADAWKARSWTAESLVHERASWMCETRVLMDTETCETRVLADAGTSGREFTYVEESHGAVKSGVFKPPTETVRVPFARALAKVLRYRGSGAYVQATLSDDMARECEGGVSEAFDALGNVSQGKRLWLSLVGSVTPLHFDASWSTLVQISGKKRMILYQPFALASLDLYPDWHPLRRRGRRFPGKQLAWEAVVEPGDVLIFPPRFAHYTESLSDGDYFSVSVTQRFRRHRENRENPNNVAEKFRRWLNHRDRPNSFARLVSTGLVDAHIDDVLSRDALTGEIEPMDTSGWENPKNAVWRLAAKECAAIVRQSAKDLIGIYCRGSVARGTARSKISDVDLIVISRCKLREDSIRDQIQEFLPLRFSDVRKFDIRFEYASSENELSDAVRFILATQCVTLYGEHLPKTLPNSARIPVHQLLHSISEDVSAALDNGSERAIIWVLKRLIRASFEAYALPHVSVGYTRDLLACAEQAALFADIDMRSDLATAVVLCIHSPRVLYGEVLWKALAEALVRRLEACIKRL